MRRALKTLATLMAISRVPPVEMAWSDAWVASSAETTAADTRLSTSATRLEDCDRLRLRSLLCSSASCSLERRTTNTPSVARPSCSSSS